MQIFYKHLVEEPFLAHLLMITVAVLQISMDMASAQGGLPALWSSERPTLYHLVVALVRNDGSVVDAESCQVALDCIYRNNVFSVPVMRSMRRDAFTYTDGAGACTCRQSVLCIVLDPGMKMLAWPTFVGAACWM